MRKVDIAPNVHAIQLMRVNVHVIVDGDDVVLIDTGYAGSLSRIEHGLIRIGTTLDQVRQVICTHGHPDHAGGARSLAQRGVQILIHPADAANLDIGLGDFVRHPSRGRFFAAVTPALPNYTPLADGDVIPILGGLEVIHTPGHTPGSVCLYARRHGLLFVGDVLQRRFGKVSFASGLYSDDAAAAQKNVQRLAELDVKTIVFSHYAPLQEGAAATLATLVRQASNR